MHLRIDYISHLAIILPSRERSALDRQDALSMVDQMKGLGEFLLILAVISILWKLKPIRVAACGAIVLLWVGGAACAIWAITMAITKDEKIALTMLAEVAVAGIIYYFYRRNRDRKGQTR